MIEVGTFTVYEEDDIPRYLPGLLFLPKVVFAELAARVPDLVKPSGSFRKIEVSDAIDSSSFQTVWQFLEKRGIRPQTSYERPTEQTFSYEIVRQFTEQELLEAAYLNVKLNQIFTIEGYRVPELCVKSWRPHKFQVGCVKIDQWIIVSAKARQEMEQAGLALSFWEFFKYHDKSVIPGFFEVTSPTRMPILKNLKILNGQQQPYTGDPNGVWYLHEGYYKTAQLHFDKAEFEKLGSFDLGLTTEVFNGPAMANRKNVCSNRLFRFLRQYDKTLHATPIRLSLFFAWVCLACATSFY